MYGCLDNGISSLADTQQPVGSRDTGSKHINNIDVQLANTARVDSQLIVQADVSELYDRGKRYNNVDDENEDGNAEIMTIICKKIVDEGRDDIVNENVVSWSNDAQSDAISNETCEESEKRNIIDCGSRTIECNKSGVDNTDNESKRGHRNHDERECVSNSDKEESDNITGSGDTYYNDDEHEIDNNITCYIRDNNQAFIHTMGNSIPPNNYHKRIDNETVDENSDVKNRIEVNDLNNAETCDRRSMIIKDVNEEDNGNADDGENDKEFRKRFEDSVFVAESKNNQEADDGMGEEWTFTVEPSLGVGMMGNCNDKGLEEDGDASRGDTVETLDNDKKGDNSNVKTNNDVSDMESCNDNSDNDTVTIHQDSSITIDEIVNDIPDTKGNENYKKKKRTGYNEENADLNDNTTIDVSYPLSRSEICYYKAKCLQKDQETMNRREKVKVDESEPSYNEEAPFERRDVVVRKDRWVTDLYAVDSVLGRGKFGEVKRCRERRTGRQLAAKFIEVSGPQDRTDVINELEIMKHLQHPRLLQLYDAFENRDRFCLVLELVCGGELFERVINEDFILTERACVMFMRQICDGVAFMHSESILHLDMKPENILCLTREGNRIKIIDFGLARKYNPKDDLRVLFGTPEFVAPEVVNFDPISPPTDMWSVGVICYVLLSGLSPFMGETEADTLSNVTMARWDFGAEEFENISPEAKDFIAKLLVKDPRKRMSAADCLEHQWLRRSVKRENRLPERSLSKKRLRKFVYRRKWQKAINAMLALRRMGVSLS